MSNRGSIRASVRSKIARKTTRRCRENQAANRKRLGSLRLNDIDGDFFRATVNRMTNKQRHAWARAKYPGLRKKTAEPLFAFVPREKVEIARSGI